MNGLIFAAVSPGELANVLYLSKHYDINFNHLLLGPSPATFPGNWLYDKRKIAWTAKI